MRKFVTASDLPLVVEKLADESLIGLDTETYGLKWTDRMFSLQLATREDAFYFNFHDYGDGDHLQVDTVMDSLSLIWNDPNKVFAIHNAKYDMRRLSIEGVHLAGGVHCTQMCARFVYNQHTTGYSLAACLKRIGREKSDKVAEYIKEHKLYDEERNPQYWKVPLPIMFEYGIIDAEEVRILAEYQREKLLGKKYYENDLQFQKTLFRMEERGIEVRQDYAQGGLEYERSEQKKAEHKLTELAGESFRAGPNWLRTYFDRLGVQYSTNDKTGKPIFDKHALAAIDHPSADLIRQYRRHEKYASTYYEHYAVNPVVHAFIKPFGTDTGRLSYAEPNLQNVPKEEDLDLAIEYQVRGCFKPREDHFLVMIDFDQQEFRVLLDYAGEHELISKINEHGLDVHQATADMVGCTRKHAKTLNFGLLYGMGAEKLAKALGVDLYTAQQIKGQYFAKLPKVKGLIRAIVHKAETKKVINTWTGRPLFFPIKEFAYAAPNHLIQGGCGDIARLAMVPIDELLMKRKARSAMLIQVHDELVFEIHKDELDLIAPIVQIMENTYRPINGMRLTCGVDHSAKSWGKRDVVKGMPILVA